MELEKIGNVQKLHGFKGQLLLRIDEGVFPKWDLIQCLFIPVNGIPTPFFLSDKEAKEKVIIRFEEHTTDSSTKKFIGCEIFVLKNQIEEKVSSPNNVLIGKELIDKKFGNLGKVLRIESYPQHEVMVVAKHGKEILLPITEEFIVSIDEENNTLHYHSPEGLIEVYLS